MTDDMKAIVCELLKFIFFGCYIALAIVFVILITSIDIQALGHIPENSWTERTQEALLGISVLLFTYRIRQEKAPGLYLVAGLLLCMLIREWDVIFDNIFHGAWKFVAIPAAMLFIRLTLKDGVKAACQHLRDFFNTPAYHLLFAGLIIVLVVSRIIGMRFMVQIISGPHFHQSVKSFLEEGTELLGYIIIFTSSLSYCLVPEISFNFLSSLLKPLKNSNSDADCAKGR
ncbi:MAG: hypothetical protein ACI3XC_05265 [Phascolarctobacterium sp.]